LASDKILPPPPSSFSDLPYGDDQGVAGIEPSPLVNTMRYILSRIKWFFFLNSSFLGKHSEAICDAAARIQEGIGEAKERAS